jgi:hypothetical protein
MGFQIRGHLKLHALQKINITAVEVPGVDPEKCSRVDMKEQVEELLINHNIEQLSHAGDTPFGYFALGDELDHTGDTPMADDVYAGTLENRYLIDRDIKAIVTQLRKHNLARTPKRNTYKRRTYKRRYSKNLLLPNSHDECKYKQR